jgi:hypothetical protein
VNSNTVIGSLPTLQISLVIVALFEKIYDGEPILTVVSNIGEDVQGGSDKSGIFFFLLSNDTAQLKIIRFD